MEETFRIVWRETAKMQLKRRFLVNLFLLGAVTLPGCAVSQPQPPPPPAHAGAVVRVACPSEALARLIDKHSRGWQGRQQAHVDVVRFDPVQGPEQAGPCDIWLIPAGDLGRWVAADRLLPVPETLTSPDSGVGWLGLLPLYRDKLLVWDRTVFALPVVGDAPLCYFRSDRFEDSRHQARFKQQYHRGLRPPATWEEFEQIAAYFAHPEGEPAGPSLPPLPADDEALDRVFHAVAAAYACRAVPEEEKVAAEQRAAVFSFHYDLQTGKPRIDSPGFVHALQLLQRLQRYRAPGTGSAAEAFRTGQAVLCLGQAWAGELFQRSKESKVRDRFGICRIPGGEGYFATRGTMQPAPSGVNVMPYLGAAAFLGVVPRSSANPEAAFALLADLAGRETSTQIVLDVAPGSRWAGGAVRQDQLGGRARWDAFDLDEARLKELQESLRSTLDNRSLKNPVLCLRTPTSREHRRVLLEEVRSALLNGEDAQKALSRAARRWTEMDQQRGLDKVLAEYRISLGLLAR